MWSFFSRDPSKELVNFELQEQIQVCPELQEKSIWNLNNAKKKNTLTQSSNQIQNEYLLSSVFSYQVKQGNEAWMPAAKNAFKRMKTLRHPNILMFIDGVETDKAIYIATERVQPLYNYLNESNDSQSQKENEISYGLYQIATAISFLNNDCKLVHNNVCLSSIVVNRAGEWKLSGFEYAHSVEDLNPTYKILHSLDVYDPPEKSPIPNVANSFKQNANLTESRVDSWGLGCLIWEIFNGVLTNKKNLQNPGTSMPKKLLNAYHGLLSSQINKRLSSAQFLSLCRQEDSFMSNHFVDTLLFLENIQIKEQNEKTKFFTELTQKLDDFPSQLCIYKILPQLLNAYEFGNAGSSVLAPLFKLGKLLDETEYQKKIIPVVVKLFSSTDRTTRMRLLQQLELFIEHLSAPIINDQIFPHICQGFSDTNPAIRESTIRSIVLLAPKLNYNNMNVELMKHFARLQGTDDQGMIRANTTVCIGKIATYINPQLRQRILLSAFPKAMRDPFPLARLSGVVALANTERFYTLRDISSKVLPNLCILCVDSEKDVRDEVFKTVKLFMAKLEKVSEQPELAIEYEKDVSSCDLNIKNETSWTSWAMTSLSAKMTGYKNKNQGPSVALNIQPLGPPPNLTTTAISNASDNLGRNSTILETNKEQHSTITNTKTKSNDNEIFSSINKNSKINDASENGWNIDEDNEWKDLDDVNDDNNQIENLDPADKTRANSIMFSSTNKKEKSEIVNKEQSPTTNEWSNWTNSFEDEKHVYKNPADDLFNVFDKSINIHNASDSLSIFNKINLNSNMPSNKLSQQISDAKTHNLKNSSDSFNKLQNEDDLFSNFVNDSASKIKATNEQSIVWENDWNNFENNKGKIK